jgi:sirohydrochlorin ferrochelatase
MRKFAHGKSIITRRERKQGLVGANYPGGQVISVQNFTSMSPNHSTKAEPGGPKGRGPAVLLVDNGSLEPAATRSLRGLAERLGAVVGRVVRPVSLLHSSAIAPERLYGRAAEILEPVLRELTAAGREVVVVPLFFGPSGALKEYLPERVRQLRKTWPGLRVRLAPCLVDTARPQDTRVAAMLAERVREAAKAAGFARPAVAVVDHGSPQRGVNAVRELVTEQMRALMGDWTRGVAACSMERRAGAEYDFNEPLLEKLLDAPEFAEGEVVVAQLFLQPGRHAGPGGDVEKICEAAKKKNPGVKILVTEPLGNHPGLVGVLAERLEGVLSSGRGMRATEV